MGNLKIGSIVSIIDEADTMKNKMGSVVFYDEINNKILVRFGGEKQWYYRRDQLKEY